MTAGMATRRPAAVVMSASEMPLETAPRPPWPDAAIAWKALMMPMTAPFIGLFGTVVGIVHAFKEIALANGQGGFATVSQGIAEALLTTALGLVVAVPAAWMFNFISQRVQHLGVEMESSSSELLDYFLERERR